MSVQGCPAPAGYSIKASGKAYKYYTATKNFDDAADDCLADEAWLAMAKVSATLHLEF